MKTEKTRNEKEENNWALPEVNHTPEEFAAGIHLAEEGPFYTLEEVQILRSQPTNAKRIKINLLKKIE